MKHFQYGVTQKIIVERKQFGFCFFENFAQFRAAITLRYFFGLRVQ